MDTTEFTNQLVAYSQVEQQIQTNSHMETLIAAQADSNYGEALDMLGNEVEVIGETFRYDGDAVNLGYGMPDGIQSATIQILSASGNVVYEQAADTSFGRHEITWDGATTNGADVLDGTYLVQVAALDADGEQVAIPTFHPRHR